MIFLNILTLTFFIFEFFFFFSKLVLERSPQSIFFWTGFLCIIYLTYFSILKCYKLYRYFVPVKENSKFRAFLVNCNNKIIRYLDVDFVQKFLSRSFYINWFFYKNMLIFIKISDFLIKILKTTFIFPWILFLLLLFFELSTQNYFFFTLYTLSFWFVVRKMLLLLTWLAYHKHCQMIRYIKTTYFDLWPEKVFDFFIFNRLFINSMLFTEETLANRKMITFLWNTYSEIFYYQTVCGAIQFFFKNRVVLEKVLLKINKILISFIFFFYVIKKIDFLFNLSYFDIIFVFSFFGATFLIFLEGLKYLGTDFSLVGYNNISEFKKSQENFMVDTKKQLLETYSFLEDSDLPLIFVNFKTPKDFILQEKDPFKSCFTEEEDANFTRILEGYDDFAYAQLKAGFLNSETQSFNYEAYEKSIRDNNSSSRKHPIS